MKRNTGLWIVQGLLAAMFLLAGGSKLVMSAAQMTAPGPVWFRIVPDSTMIWLDSTELLV